MLKKSMLLFSSLCLSVIGLAQQLNSAVISAAGDVAKTSHLYLEWTLGEPIIESVSADKKIYTQGFHQPYNKTKSRLVKPPAAPEWCRITILPNPVQTVCRVVIEKQSESKLYLELSDINGRPITAKTSNAKYQTIDFNLSSFSAGVYTLLMRNANGTLYKTFKIIKAQ